MKFSASAAEPLSGNYHSILQWILVDFLSSAIYAMILQNSKILKKPHYFKY